MEYIRHLKAQKEWDANQVHCLYGLDADLIMLSLVTHEPHFALIREEGVLDRKKKRAVGSPDQKFHLLHISLVREYLEMDFESLKHRMPFPYSFERVVDDFIMMSFFVGNDFLPGLPSLDIAEGALNMLFKLYKDIIPTLDGYLTTAGQMNWSRVEVFLRALGKHEKHMFDIIPPHLEQVEKRLKAERQRENKTGKPILADVLYGGSQDKHEDLLVSNDSIKSEDEEDDEYWKTSYYREKFDFKAEDKEAVRKLVKSYLEAIAWVLHYYYDGCVSWSWYYPYHYPPLVSGTSFFVQS